MFYRAKAPPAKKNVGLWGREWEKSMLPKVKKGGARPLGPVVEIRLSPFIKVYTTLKECF